MNRRHKKRQKIRLFFFCLIVFLIIVLCFFTERQIKPIIISSAENRAQIIAVKAINSAVVNKMKNINITYYDLVNFQKDDNNKISAISANMVEINKLKSEFTTAISEELTRNNDIVVSVSLGTLLNLPDGGPRIKLHLSMYGNVDTDISDSFSEAGINQTKHEILLDVQSSVRVMVPFYSVRAEVKTSIPIAQTVIIGDVPKVYANIVTDKNN